MLVRCIEGCWLALGRLERGERLERPGCRDRPAFRELLARLERPVRRVLLGRLERRVVLELPEGLVALARLARPELRD